MEFPICAVKNMTLCLYRLIIFARLRKREASTEQRYQLLEGLKKWLLQATKTKVTINISSSSTVMD